MTMKWSDIKEDATFFITEEKSVTLVNGNKRKGHHARSYLLPAGTKGKVQVVGDKRRIFFPQHGYVEADPNFNINLAFFRFPDLPTWGTIARSNWPKVQLREVVQYVDNGQAQGQTIPKLAGEVAQVHLTDNGYPLLLFADGFRAVAGLSEDENVDTTIYEQVGRPKARCRQDLLPYYGTNKGTLSPRFTPVLQNKQQKQEGER